MFVCVYFSWAFVRGGSYVDNLCPITMKDLGHCAPFERREVTRIRYAFRSSLVWFVVFSFLEGVCVFDRSFCVESFLVVFWKPVVS